MDNATFRSAFPEFASTTTYPDSQLNFWAGVAEKMLKPDVWEDMYDNAVYLYVAHEITVAAQNAKTAANGGAPGTFGGIAQSKAVGGVSVTYNATMTAKDGASFWNLTTYGTQLYRWILLFGAGCLQL